MDEDSLADAETSLQNMLRDFVHDTHNEIPEDLRWDGEKVGEGRAWGAFGGRGGGSTL